MANLIKVHEVSTDADTWLNWEMISTVQSTDGDMVIIRMVNSDTYRVRRSELDEL